MQILVKGEKMLNDIAGLEIIFSDNACNPEFELVERTWKERLFSKPWNPIRKYKQVMKALNPQIFRIGNKVVMHSSFINEIHNIKKY